MKYDQWDDAGRQAMERWGSAIEGIGSEGGRKGAPPAEAIVQRYLREHRNNPRALLEFARRNVGDQRAAEEAQRYRQQMEQMLQGR